MTTFQYICNISIGNMGDPVAFQEQEASSSTVTLVETDEQVCKHVLLRNYTSPLKVNMII